MQVSWLLAAAFALCVRADDDLLTIVSVFLYAYGVTIEGPDNHYPTVVEPTLPPVVPSSVPLAPFEAALYENLMQTDYLLAITAPGEQPWQVYHVKDLLGRKAMFHCDNIIFSDWHHSRWGQEPHRSFLHWQAEWHNTAHRDCYFVMSPAAESPPEDGLEYFGRFPAGLQLMYLIKSGIIQTGADPWLLYVDTDIFFTRPGDLITDMAALINNATKHADGTLEEVYTKQRPQPLDYSNLALVVATDVGCASKQGPKWPRLNSGTLLFRPVPFAAYILDATVKSWTIRRRHNYDRLDQAMLTLVLTDAFDFPHDTLRRLCRSDPKPWITQGADKELWRDSCEGSQLIFARTLNHVRASTVPETRDLLEKWLPAGRVNGPSAMALACNRVLGGSMAGTPLWVSNDLWNWQCGDVGMHMIGGMGFRGGKYRTLVARWREKHFAPCRMELAMQTMLDGTPILSPVVPYEGKKLHPRLGANLMRPFTAKEKLEQRSWSIEV